jgi:bifunctional non-homologous end joining protein LigD
MLLLRTLPAGFIAPCLPMKAPRPPSGPLWLHEVKHDGFRIIARKDGERVRLYSPPGNDLTNRFPLIVEAMARLPSSCTIDGEAVACDDNGVASFNLLLHRKRDDHVFLYVFDLIEVGGGDLRREPLEQRKIELRRLLADTEPGLVFNEWIDGGDFDGATVFEHAQSLGLEGIVSKRKDALRLGTIAVLAQNEESGERGDTPRGGGGVGSAHNRRSVWHDTDQNSLGRFGFA